MRFKVRFIEYSGDIDDIRMAFDMDDATSEMLGFFIGDRYKDSKTRKILEELNIKNTKKR